MLLLGYALQRCDLFLLASPMHGWAGYEVRVDKERGHEFLLTLH